MFENQSVEYVINEIIYHAVRHPPSYFIFEIYYLTNTDNLGLIACVGELP